jgi:hypothetical protein
MSSFTKRAGSSDGQIWSRSLEFVDILGRESLTEDGRYCGTGGRPIFGFAMVETRSILLPWFLHFVPDAVIYVTSALQN